MPLAIDSDSVAFRIGEWSPGPILLLVGLLLVVSGRRAGHESPGSGSTKRVWGTALIVVAGLLLVARIATAARESTDDGRASTGAAFASQSAGVIVNTAIRQMQDRVTSLRITGTTSTAETQSSFVTVFDVEGRCRSTFDQGDESQTFIFDTTAAYVKANRAGWRSLLGSEKSARHTIALVQSKWALFLRTDMTEGVPQASRHDRFCDFGRLFDSMSAEGGKGMTVGDRSLAGGVESIEVLGKTGSANVRFWVEVAAPHHLLRFVLKNDGVSADTSFADFNQPLASFVPPKRDVVDFR